MISCLRRAGVDVAEVHASVWDDTRRAWSAGAERIARLALAEGKLLRRRIPPDADAVIVGYPGHVDLSAARRAARGRPIVFNPLVSLADTFISDRARFQPGSVAARILERVDRHAFASADVVVADTDAQAGFFAQLTNTPIEVCFVGAEDDVFAPRWEPSDPFTAVFVGKLIPLQGADVILEAARRAPELRFRVIGSGQLDALLERRPPNVEHVAWVEYDRLPQELECAGCALGIFGTTAKAARVIPNKAFQAIASATPLVTADTPAARELLRDDESALLVPPGDPDALAAAVRRLAGDRALAERLSRSGRATYEGRASEAVLGPRWCGIIERVL